ncbi:MAG: putative toxin-antitoxin system toxin component, PIN family [Blastocatellia bacterium]
MPRRKDRLPVVLDTNVIVSFFLSRRARSASAEIFALWFRQRKLQLIVSDELVAEYLEVLTRLPIPEKRVAQFRERLQVRETVTHVNLGARHAISRDPDDDLLLATAAAGQAHFLITNDHDLLDIPLTQKRRFRFEIVTPGAFLTRWKQ